MFDVIDFALTGMACEHFENRPRNTLRPNGDVVFESIFDMLEKVLFMPFFARFLF